MNAHRGSGTVRLTKGYSRVLASGRGVDISCSSGSVWVMRRDASTDVHVRAGERYVSDQGGSLLVYAPEPAVLTSNVHSRLAAAPSLASSWASVVRYLRQARDLQRLAIRSARLYAF